MHKNNIFWIYKLMIDIQCKYKYQEIVAKQ